MIDRFKAIGKLLVGKNLTPDEAFRRGLPIDVASSGNKSTTAAYERSAIAYACIRRLAVDAGNAPFLLLTDPEDPESTIPDTHIIAELFRQPNPWYETNQFMEFIYTMLNLRGEFFITFDSETAPTEMIPFYDPLYWTGKVTSDMRLVGWEYRHQTVEFSMVPGDLIHHKLTNIAQPFRGQSPLKAAASALWTEIDGDHLTANIMSRGGEQGIVYTTDEKLIGTQEAELQASLRARRAGSASIANDILLTGGMNILDPKFTGFDYALFDRMSPAEQKIVQVYGLSPSLIGRDDEPNYATFKGRVRIYWQQTLIPMMTAVESTFSQFFEPFGVYFRYDRANIAGLQEDLKELTQIALILNKGGVPWTVINERLKLGLAVDEIPGADEIMVPATVVPLSLMLDEYANPPEPVEPVEPPPPPESPESDDENPEPDDTEDEPEVQDEDNGTAKHPDYATVKARSKDISSLIARNRKLSGLERAVASAWRKQVLRYKKMALREIDLAFEQNHTADQAVMQFRYRFEPSMTVDFPDESVENIIPRSVQAVGEGEVSIEELTKRLTADEIKHFSKEPADLLSAASVAFVAERSNLVKGMGPRLFNSMMKDIDELVRHEGETAEIAQKVRGMVSSSFSASVNRAVTIGRTEVGTAFNVGRFNNMKEQGYAHHEWITNIDEMTREDHAESDGEVRKVGDIFSSGLDYPQSPMGDAEQVINCRCMTIPITQEQFDERKP